MKKNIAVTHIKIIFGLTLDENAIFAPPPQYNTPFEGTHIVGQRQFLHLFESLLGLAGHIERIEHIRTEIYRQALARFLRLYPTAFFAAAFDADQLATAEALLARRDELLLAGYNFDARTAPERLATIADIEHTLTDDFALPKGYADRFETVLQKIVTQQPFLSHLKSAISQILLNEPLDILPPQYQRIFAALSAQGIDIQQVELPKIQENNVSDLGVFKKFICSEQKPETDNPFQNDGSLLLIEADNDALSAAFLAKVFEKNPKFKPHFLIADNARSLDAAFIQNGIPAFGVLSQSFGRPTLQLLKLVTTFIWRPLDPHKVLEFVTLQTKPLADDLATVIATLIAQRPGTNGEQWYYEVNNYFEKLEAKGDPNRAEIKRQFEFWFDRPTYDIEKSAPTDEIIAIFDFLSRWASDTFEVNNKNTSLLVLAEQAKRVREYLEMLPTNDKFLTYLELERIIRTIYEPAPVQPCPTEKGSFPYTTHSASILSDVAQLVWWHFANTEGGHFFSRWYTPELDFLAEKKVFLTSPKKENALQVWQRKQAILRTQKQVIFIYNKKANGKDCEEHPLISHLRACFKGFDDKILKINKLNNSNFSLNLPNFAALEPHILRKPRPFVSITTSRLTQREEETLTSLETLFYYPHQWVFKHKARLNKSHILSVVKENTLKGNLAHRFFELILNEIKDDDLNIWTREKINEKVDNYSKRLFQNEAATLLMYGYEPQRVQFLRQVKYAIWTLISSIRENEWQIEATEQDLKGKFSGLSVKGKADVVLSRQNGEKTVLDLKWGGRSYRESLIRNGEDLQLVMYSRLLSEKEEWAQTAYFIIENARILARNSVAFKEARALTPDKDAVAEKAKTWDLMLKTYNWRKHQILRGWIEIRTTQTVNALDELHGESLLQVLEMKNADSKFDDYQSLIGLIR